MTDLGGFLVKLTLQSPQSDFNRVKQDLKDVRKEAAGFGEDFRTAGQTIISVMGKMTAAALALSAAVSKIAVSSATAGAAKAMDVSSGSAFAGISAQKYYSFTNAFIRAQMSPESGGEVLKSLQNRMEMVKAGDFDEGYATKLSQLLGIEDMSKVYDLQKHTPSDVLAKQMIEAYEKAPGYKKSFMLALLNSLEPILADFATRGGTSNFSAASARMNPIDWAKQQKYALNQGNLSLDWANVTNKFNAKMAEVLDKYVVGLDRWFNDPKNQETIDAFIAALGKLVDAIIGAAGAIGKLVFGDKSSVIGATQGALVDMVNPAAQAEFARQDKLYSSYRKEAKKSLTGSGELHYGEADLRTLTGITLRNVADNNSFAKMLALENLEDFLKSLDEASVRSVVRMLGMSAKETKSDDGKIRLEVAFTGDTGLPYKTIETEYDPRNPKYTLLRAELQNIGALK